jgi:hypothetical protein
VYPIGAVGCSSSELEPELPSPRRGDPGPGQAGREREKTKSEKVVNAGKLDNVAYHWSAQCDGDECQNEY